MYNVPTLRAVYTKGQGRVTKFHLVTQSPFSLPVASHVRPFTFPKCHGHATAHAHVSMATQSNFHVELAQEEVWQSCRDRPQDKWKTTRLDILCSTVAPSVPRPAPGSRTGKDLSAVGGTGRSWARLQAPVQADITSPSPEQDSQGHPKQGGICWNTVLRTTVITDI